MVRIGITFVFALMFSATAWAGNWNSGSMEATYTNDFSETVYGDWANFNTTGPHPTAARVQDGKLIVTLTKDMLDTHSNKTGRFEIEKQNIHKNLATYQKFKIRSVPDNNIFDRIVIAQVKQFNKGGSGIPQATVNLDRPPACATYSKKNNFQIGEMVLANYTKFGVENAKRLYTQKRNGWFVTEWQHDGYTNTPWLPLADGQWHTVEMDVYPHERKGYCSIKVDGQLWVSIMNAPTKSLGGGKIRYAARIGIYRDAVNNTHSVEFDNWQVETYNPSGGPRMH
jgi:hypothetical protein